MTNSILTQASNTPTGLGSSPACQQAKALSVPLPAGATTLIDLSILQQQKQIDFVSSIYLRTGADAVEITIEETNQHLSIPAMSCAYLPVAAPISNTKLTVVGNSTPLLLLLFNYYVGPCVWTHP